MKPGRREQVVGQRFPQTPIPGAKRPSSVSGRNDTHWVLRRTRGSKRTVMFYVNLILMNSQENYPEIRAAVWGLCSVFPFISVR
jgi:hypothetical protein